jgi:hypothetical protein
MLAELVKALDAQILDGKVPTREREERVNPLKAGMAKYSLPSSFVSKSKESEKVKAEMAQLLAMGFQSVDEALDSLLNSPRI